MFFLLGGVKLKKNIIVVSFLIVLIFSITVSAKNTIFEYDGINFESGYKEEIQTIRPERSNSAKVVNGFVGKSEPQKYKIVELN